MRAVRYFWDFSYVFFFHPLLCRDAENGSLDRDAAAR